MKENIPYTYYLYCKPIQKHYYGVRYSKTCHPDDFWKSYFTSSKIIHYLIEQYGKDAFYWEIKKTFKTAQAAVAWENKVLRRLKVHERTNWLNRHFSNGTVNFYSIGEEPWNKGVPNKFKGSKFYNNRKCPKNVLSSVKNQKVGLRVDWDQLVKIIHFMENLFLLNPDENFLNP